MNTKSKKLLVSPHLKIILFSVSLTLGIILAISLVRQTSTPVANQLNTPSQVAAASTSGGLFFNGTSNFARTNVDLPYSATYTYELWLRRGQGTGGYESFLSDATSSYNNATMIMYIDGAGLDCSGGAGQFAIYDIATSTSQCSGSILQSGATAPWYHLAVSRESNGTRRLFINGQIVSTRTGTASPQNSTNYLALGRPGAYNGEYFNGYIDEVRVSNTALYTANFNPQTIPLVADSTTNLLWHLDEGTGQVLTDSSLNTTKRNGYLGSSSSNTTADPQRISDSPISGSPSTATPSATPGGSVSPTPTRTPSPTPTIVPTASPTPSATVVATPTPTPTPSQTPVAGGYGTALRFFGNGVNGIDRVEIPIDSPATPADVGATNFTIEWWMKAVSADNIPRQACSSGNDSWINGNIILDRDIWGNGDSGDYGIALFNGRIAFGVNNGTSGNTLCGTRNVADNAWHHIAVTRQSSDGFMRIFVDGQLDASVDGVNGDISYRNNRPTNYPKDRFLVIGAEKHDAGTEYPSYDGHIDELRISNTLRYTSSFTRPSGAFSTDANTLLLYHFNEGSGLVTVDSSGNNTSGSIKYGGNPAGPVYVPSM